MCPLPGITTNREPGTSREKETPHARGPRRHVRLREHRTPRVAEQVHLAEAKRVAQRLELPHVAIDGEQRRIRRTIGLAASELIVDDDGPVGGKREERLEV